MPVSDTTKKTVWEKDFLSHWKMEMKGWGMECLTQKLHFWLSTPCHIKLKWDWMNEERSKESRTGRDRKDLFLFK